MKFYHHDLILKKTHHRSLMLAVILPFLLAGQGVVRRQCSLK
jgi:hypothetical protein